MLHESTIVSAVTHFSTYSISLTSMADYHVPDEFVSWGQGDYGRVRLP